ncbi:MAG TPA: hypothetical protein VFS31_07700 [Chitinophagaceae bacterium]|nr:hypothetical protein [Chitinophagaceae bacterium]
MDEELRNRYRRDFTREPIRANPLPQPSQTQPPAPTSVQPTAPAQTVIAEATPESATAVPIPKPIKDKSQKRRIGIKPVLIIMIVALLAGSGFTAYNKFLHKAPAKHYFPSYITKEQMQIPVYYPVDLPASFKVNDDYKVIQKNVLYYSVSNRSGDKFYLTIQPYPSSFDMVSFKKKFIKPDEYNTSIGSSLVGVAGSSLLGSTVTNKNVWIIFNSTAVGSIKDMETITRSLQEVPL